MASLFPQNIVMSNQQQQEDELLIESPKLNADGSDLLSAAEQQADEAVPEKELADDRPAFLNDDESDEDDFVVTIGEIKTNVFQKQQRVGTVGGATIDLDANSTLKDGSQIYDIDLATMEDKPWRKPGADITDYFNYGFNEETWNQYCERQRKFRAEFGTDQAAINKAILSNIQVSGSVQVGLQTFAGGRQLVSLVGGQESKQQQNKVQKIVLDLSKPPPSIADQAQSMSLISRTVISGSGIITRQESSSEMSSSLSQPNAVESAVPQPITSLGSSTVVVAAGQPHISIGQSLVHPPASETPPPGTTGAPASATQQPPPVQNISVIGSSAAPPTLTPLSMDFSKPPPSFDPAIPPPIVSAPPPGQPQQQQPQQQQPQQQPPRHMQQQQPNQTMPPQQSAPAQVTATQMPPQLAPRTSAALHVDLPPGVEDSEGPPGVEGPPGISDVLPSSRMNFGHHPPPTNQFSLGPSSMPSTGPPPSSTSFGPPGVSLHHHHPQQQQMGGGIRPAPLFHSFRNPFGGPGGGGGFVGRFHHSDRFRGGGRPFFKERSPESDNDSPRRKKRRSRSKSRSQSPSRRYKEKDEKRKERSSHREKEGRKKKEKKERHSSSSGHHKSPSRKDIKSERRSSEREKDSLEKESRRRSPNRRDKEMLTIRTLKTERRTPDKD